MSVCEHLRASVYVCVCMTMCDCVCQSMWGHESVCMCVIMSMRVHVSACEYRSAAVSVCVCVCASVQIGVEMLISFDNQSNLCSPSYDRQLFAVLFWRGKWIPADGSGFRTVVLINWRHVFRDVWQCQEKSCLHFLTAPRFDISTEARIKGREFTFKYCKVFIYRKDSFSSAVLLYFRFHAAATMTWNPWVDLSLSTQRSFIVSVEKKY